jgi:DNA-binding NtrC family response regulator
VRQLNNVLERAVLLADGPVLLPAHLPVEVRAPVRAVDDFGTSGTASATFANAGPVQTPSHGLPHYGLPSYGLPSAGLPGYGLPPQVATAAPMPSGGLLPLGELERRHIAHALALTGGHLARAAELLGIHRNTLRRKLQDYAEASGHPVDQTDRLGAASSAPQENVMPLAFEMPAPEQIS